MTKNNQAFKQALKIGRPPNIKKLFPNSNALIVSGKFIDRALIKKGKAIALAANGRSYFIIKGVLQAAQKANAAVILEIAKSEGGINGYCAVNFWNLARIVDFLCNQLNITVPVAIHADHYKIKTAKDIEEAKNQIPSLFDAGITSMANDASFLPEDKNLNANILLSSYIPSWAGFETEVGEIKGAAGLSTVEDSLFLTAGLNAYNIFPDWLALNNGTVHGIEESGGGIQVELTKKIHRTLAPYTISGAQHGTSGNSLALLKKITEQTKTTKANVATALQMISWGVKTTDTGNAVLDDNGDFIKVKGLGVSQEVWEEMQIYALNHNLKAGDLKKSNLAFENRLMSQSKKIKERMAKGVEEFAYNLIKNIFNSENTAPLVYESIIEADSYSAKPKGEKIENKKDWTPEKIIFKASLLKTSKDDETGDFDD
ncbi:MAG: class II fructose-bisphosphate aldolase [Deltaproteobacteria bacterium]|nr:class II fructose-bisphosphate aldolase [Deltaproteobacteria bacterium]